MLHTETLFSNLIDTVTELRSENGCPWDRRQSSESLLKYLKSEVQELIDAINNDDPDNICEELGDVLYLIVMISQINNDNGNFAIDRVIEGITEKLIRRHPHVFAGLKVEDEEELREQWQRIKAAEKSKK